MLRPCLLFVLLFSLNETAKAQKNSDIFKIEIVNNFSSPVYFSFIDRIDSVGGAKRTNFSGSTDINSLPLLFFISTDKKKGFKTLRLLYTDLKDRKIIVSPQGKISLHSNLIEDSINAIYATEGNVSEAGKLTSLISENRNNLVAAYLVLDNFCNTTTPVDSLSKYFGILSSDNKASYIGSKISKFLKGRREFKENMLVNDFSLKDSSGEKKSMYSIKSRFILLDFWFSRCGPCIASFPDLIKLYKNTSRDNFEVVGITVDANRNLALWKSTMLKHELPWINLIDPEYSISYHTFSIDTYPTKVLIDSKTHRIVKINPTNADILSLLN